MCTQDPVQSVIWQCLNYYDYKNAIFLAERWCIEAETDEAIHLLATAYYRAKQIPQAYWLLKKKCCRSPQCRYLQARCAYELKEYTAAEYILTNNGVDELRNFEEFSKDFAEITSFVLQLMGQIYRNTERAAKATKAFRQALKLNPFMWQAYVELCNMGEDLNVKETFMLRDVTLKELMIVSHCRHHCHQCKQQFSKDATKESCYTPKPNVNPVCTAACNNCSTPLNAESAHFQSSNVESGFALLTEQFNSLTSISPVTPSSAAEKQKNIIGGESSTTAKATVVKANETLYQPSSGNVNAKLHVFTPAGNTPTRSASFERQNLKTQVLNLETDSAKENKQSIGLSKWSPRKLKYRFTKEIRLDESDEDSLLTNNATDKSHITKTQPSMLGDSAEVMINNTTQQHLLVQQPFSSLEKQLADNLLGVLIYFGLGYKLLSSYQCKKAIKHFELNAPQLQFNSSGLQSMIAKCHYELQHYSEAAKIFKRIHETEPCRFEYMDVYSSCLWQLQQPVELSALAQELVNCDRLSPITWCVAGNCFSLQNDHTTAIKLTQRAVQVDADFAYGYTLLGYEHVYHEDLDEARSCFESAVARDCRHYNAWFGIGTTYAKQQKHKTAEFYFRKALRINPTNSVIHVHIAVMQHAQQHFLQALLTLNTASKLNPDNLIAKLQRARICFALKRYPQALEQLEELKNVAPKESVVFQLLGNVHQAMGQNEMALMYFSWSMDMDSKKAEPFTPVLPKRWL